MKPKTKLVFSMIYGSRFDPGFCESYLDKLKTLFSSFEKLYNENIDDILEAIAKVNEPWELEYIPIYLTINIIPFSNPLTLRYDNNPKYILTVLVHELIHNNIQKKFISRKEMHFKIDEIMECVLNELDIDLKIENEKLKQRVGNL